MKIFKKVKEWFIREVPFDYHLGYLYGYEAGVQEGLEMLKRYVPLMKRKIKLEVAELRKSKK